MAPATIRLAQPSISPGAPMSVSAAPDGATASRPAANAYGSAHPPTTPPAIASDSDRDSTTPTAISTTASAAAHTAGIVHDGPDQSTSSSPTASSTAATARPQVRVAAPLHSRPDRRAPLAMTSTMSS